MKSKIIYTLFIILFFLFVIQFLLFKDLHAQKLESYLSNLNTSNKNCLELGVQNITNFGDRYGWISENNNIFSIVSYTRYFPKHQFSISADYYKFESFKFKNFDFEKRINPFKDYNLGKVMGMRTFKHFRLSVGKYFETTKWLFNFQLQANYMFKGSESRYEGIYVQAHTYPYLFGHTTFKGFGYGGGVDVKYKIKQRFTLGGSINYGSYSLKRDFYHAFYNIYGLSNLYDENSPEIDTYNTMFSAHIKFGILF